MERPIILTRRELYDLVWSKPIREVAADLGVSDVGLSKVCDRHRVPRPEQGYWNKKQAGRKVKQTLFVETDDPHVSRIEIRGSLSQVPEPARKIIEEARAARKAASKPRKPKSETPILAPVAEPYPALARTAKLLRKGSADRNGGISAFGEGLCGIDVAADQVERAVSFLDALARALDTEGLPIKAMGRSMSVSSGSEEAIFTLKERTRQEKHAPTAEELEAEEKRQQKLRKTYGSSGGWFDLPGNRAYPEFDTIYTGEFVLQVEGYSDGVRRTWADGKTRVVENLVEDIAVGIRALLAARKAKREKREELHRTWEELERRRALASRRADREEERIGYLREIFNISGEAARLRAWLSHQEQNNTLHQVDYTRFIRWVRQRLADLEATISSEAIDFDLRAKELFPEVDELVDPLGEPEEEDW